VNPKDDMPHRKTVVPDGSICWQDEEGKPHREGGPAVLWANGGQLWYRHGEHHREDGPATKLATTKRWYLNGRLHRDDGPASEDANGKREWYRHGKKLTAAQIEAL
jgi:hypothetical protein